MSVVINGIPTPPPPGLIETIEAAGIHIWNGAGDLWYTETSAQALVAESIAATYDPIPWVRNLKKVEATGTKEAVEQGGFTTSGGIPLDTSADNQLRLLRLACSTEAFPLPSSFFVKDRNNVFRSLSRAEARNLGSDINAFFQSCTNGEGNAYAAINAANQTWQQILAINIRAFFPANS